MTKPPNKRTFFKLLIGFVLTFFMLDLWRYRGAWYGVENPVAGIVTIFANSVVTAFAIATLIHFIDWYKASYPLPGQSLQFGRDKR